MENTNVYITPSIVLEFLYCPRFIYFMEVMKIKQNEDKRFKVQKGREVHNFKTLTNTDYKRKKIGVIKKEIDVDLYSEKNNINGKIDEILFLDDNTASPLDYKFAEYKNKIYRTYKIQSIMYGILIKDNYNIEVNRGFIVYTRSKNYLAEIEHKESDIKKVKKIIDNIFEIINHNYFPKKTSVSSRCYDCCYRNICIK